MKSFALTLAFGALAVSSHAIVLIDDFADSQGPLTVNEGNTVVVDYKAAVAGAIGGSRGLALVLNSSDHKQDSTIRVGNGAFGNNEFGNASTAYLAYFSTAPVANGFQWSHLTNYDMSNANEFLFNVLGTDGDIGVTIQMFQYNDDFSVFGQRTYQSTFLAGGARTETISLANVTGETAGFDDSKVDFMWIYFSAPTNADFGLRSIEAVPEPGTLAGIGLGLAALARKRRK